MPDEEKDKLRGKFSFGIIQLFISAAWVRHRQFDKETDAEGKLVDYSYHTYYPRFKEYLEDKFKNLMGMGYDQEKMSYFFQFDCQGNLGIDGVGYLQIDLLRTIEQWNQQMAAEDEEVQNWFDNQLSNQDPLGLASLANVML